MSESSDLCRQSDGILLPRGNLRSQEDIDHYLAKERRHSIYKDAEARDQHVDKMPTDGEVDAVDDGNQ